MQEHLWVIQWPYRWCTKFKILIFAGNFFKRYSEILGVAFFLKNFLPVIKIYLEGSSNLQMLFKKEQPIKCGENGAIVIRILIQKYLS